MNLETRRFILGLIMVLLFGCSFGLAYKSAFTDGYTISNIYTMSVSVVFLATGLLIILKNTNYF